MIYLDLEDLLHIARRTLDGRVEIRDLGLLESAAMRPQTSLFGQDAYPDLETKVSALLQSIVRNHALVDGNKRLGLAATTAFLGLNGRRLTMSNDEAHDFVIAVATSAVRDLADVAAVLRSSTEPL